MGNVEEAKWNKRLKMKEEMEEEAIVGEDVEEWKWKKGIRNS